MLRLTLPCSREEMREIIARTAAASGKRDGSIHGATLYCGMPQERIDRAWMAQWRGAAVALAEQRIRELKALTEDDARAAVLALLDLGASLPYPPEREHTSGLVIQQALFHRKLPPA